MSSTAIVAPGADASEPPSTSAPDTVTTGVARGRDRLDSATSTSSLRAADVEKLAPRSVADLLRDIPGIRSEASTGEGLVSLSVRGLPLASSGIKFVQLQEDGLPVLEFGDMQGLGADGMVRADLNLAQVEVIRGGSASTFASNSPGGLVNFISKTGEIEGGAVALTAGLDYGQYRIDADQGGQLGDTWRYHIGGYYRRGEGPRTAGYDAQRGGQVKLSLTKTFDGGYVRLYGKYLDDRTPFYDVVPMRATGSERHPAPRPVASFDIGSGVLLSRSIRDVLVLDSTNQPARHDVGDGQRTRSLSGGVEAQIDVADWTVTERFRVSSVSGALVSPFATMFLPAARAASLAGVGGQLSYANGPLAGQVIADPASLNGNGLVGLLSILDLRIRDYGNVTSDTRASRAVRMGEGELTLTGGFYAARQMLDRDTLWSTMLSDVRGDGKAALVDLSTATGARLTDKGVLAYQFTPLAGKRRRSMDLDYAVNAPFASVNYHVGAVAMGGSLRYDTGSASGRLYGSDLGGGRIATVTRDIDGDGRISAPETKVGITPLTSPAPLEYTYHYLSYSTGINWHLAEPFALFARYSRGARANADRLLFSPIVDSVTGALALPRAAYDPVRQAEVGAKFRQDGLTFNVTGFWATAQDSNTDQVTTEPIERDYQAHGIELEGGVRHGIFAFNGGATLTHAEITRDAVNPHFEGNTPRHQAKLTFQATPQLVTERFSLGAVFIGTTGSYAQDNDLLRIPGYVTTGAFVQVRAAERLSLGLNASNLFDVTAISGFDDAAIPPSGILRARVLNGRTVSATARLDF
ncbi:TonB-dependent receptor domain-containing protein [Sphingomonas sp. BK345]|uniref:TonB-dependent receptor domain-containing protein n=1 Tax=Sphingomonas sp. BK345 TaxID=2586980 RepID=UPI001609D83B|nr:TonB-dependent receptor [Sphingomonas sp. BK345]MBB3475015.1 outer membrane receptor protein involved in Fe transport [Sphingomonas sp. BK345]